MFRNEINYPEPNITNAIRNELANKPRYDIEGNKRYGNTVRDDVFAMKNPNYKGHTPQSYDYFNDIEPEAYQSYAPMEPAGGWGEIMGTIPQVQTPIEQYMDANPYLKKGDFRDKAISRKKNVGEGGLDWGTWRDDWTLEDDILEFPDSYTPEQVQWAENKRAEREAKNRIASLGTDDLRAEKLGTYQDPSEWVSRRESDIDSYLDLLVNYGALSPATIEQMANMGVNHPVSNNPSMTTGDDAAEYLNFLLNAYRRMNE